MSQNTAATWTVTTDRVIGDNVRRMTISNGVSCYSYRIFLWGQGEWAVARWAAIDEWNIKATFDTMSEARAHVAWVARRMSA